MVGAAAIVPSLLQAWGCNPSAADATVGEPWLAGQGSHPSSMEAPAEPSGSLDNTTATGKDNSHADSA